VKDIGDTIREIRNKKKLSLRALGELSGVPWNTIARIERGEHESPEWKTLQKIFAALDLELAPRRPT
jgi:transcriptional regulator with XRE-family HTH domain